MKYDICEGDKGVRYALGTTCKRPLFVIGINPSSADAFDSDPTIRKVEEQISVWKEFDGFLMLNLYPVRAKKPMDIPPFDKEKSKRNAEIIRRQLGGHEQATIWAAWGAAFDKKPCFRYCLREIIDCIKCLHVSWKKCESLTKLHNPRHPLSGRPHIVNRRSRLTDFDVMNYLIQKGISLRK